MWVRSKLGTTSGTSGPSKVCIQFFKIHRICKFLRPKTKRVPRLPTVPIFIVLHNFLNLMAPIVCTTLSKSLLSVCGQYLFGCFNISVNRQSSIANIPNCISIK